MERVIFNFLLQYGYISKALIIIVCVTNCTFQYFYIIKNSFVAFLLLTKLFLSAPIKRFNYCIANPPPPLNIFLSFPPPLSPKLFIPLSLLF